MERDNCKFSIRPATDKQKLGDKNAPNGDNADAPTRNENLGIDLTLKDKVTLIKAICNDDDTGYRGHLAYAARSILYIMGMHPQLVKMCCMERDVARWKCEESIPDYEWDRGFRDMCISVISGEDARYIDNSSEYDFFQMCYEFLYDAIDTANQNDPDLARRFIWGIKTSAHALLDEGLYAAAMNAANILSYIEKRCDEMITEYEEWAFEHGTKKDDE